MNTTSDHGSEVASARSTLHRVAAHVLGRRRYEVTGRFGLRVTPGGFATPVFGPDLEALRVSGTTLVRETPDGARYLPIRGSSLRQLAEFAGADVDVDFAPGKDAPPRGDADAELDLDGESAMVLADWYALGVKALDMVLADLPGASDAAVMQLWPEHFDLGTTVGVAGGARVNLGASPGDGFVDEPYLYVGPWESERPGDPAYRNAPFGAVWRRRDLVSHSEPVATAVTFFRTGLAYLEREEHQ